MDRIRLIALVALLGLVLLLILLLPWASAPPSGAYAADLPTAAKPAAPAWANSKAPGGPSLLATSGPDDFGYTYMDSNEPCGPIFNWEDISTTGITLTLISPDHGSGLDDVAWNRTIPFTFTFYATNYITVAVSSNGYLNFDNGTSDFDSTESTNQCTITNTLAPNNAIYAFWDNLDPSAGGEIYVDTRGTAPNRRFIVQYDVVPFHTDAVTVTFQIILFEGSNNILFQYEDVDRNPRARGNSATEGIEGPGGTDGLQYENCNTAQLTNGLAVLYIFPQVVNDTGDDPDENPGDGVCDTAGTGITCTLRAAIMEANAITGTNTINFNLAGPGPHTIQPNSPLPVITDTVMINGYTQNGAITATATTSATLKIVLDGSSAGNGVNGLEFKTDCSTVRGLNIHSFRVVTTTASSPDFGREGNGIVIREGISNTITGNFIGTNVAGTACVGNGGSGVLIGGLNRTADADNNTVGGTDPEDRNIITCNGFQDNTVTGGDGVTIRANYQGGVYYSADSNTVLGNYIGTDVNGTTTLTVGTDTFGIQHIGNTGNGVRIAGGSSNTVGGTANGECNIISGNELAGVRIEAVAFDGDTRAANSNVVQGNYIGTDVNGTGDLGNLDAGVYIAGLVDDADNNVIGGTTAAARNVIAGNGGHGVMILGGQADNNTVQGNYVGTDVNGDTAIPNDAGGINITDAMTNTIGGTSDTARNLVSGNGGYGISIVNSLKRWDPDLELFVGIGEASGNTIEGNFIGTVVTGTQALSNMLSGVLIVDAADNLVRQNLISGNGANGVLIINAYPPGNVETDVVIAAGTANGNPVSGSASATVTITDTQQVAIEVTKTVTPTTVAAVGDVVTFTIRITNTSGADVTIKRLSDWPHGNLNGQGTCSVPQILGPSGSYTCTFSAEVYGLGGYNLEADVVTASGTDENGVFVIGSASATVNITDTLPSIVVTKTANPTSLASPGGTVNFTVTVKALSPVTINKMWDSKHGKLIPSGLCGPILSVALNLGDTFQCSYSANVSGATGNTVEGNFIGTDVTGTFMVPNQAAGVAIAAPDNAIEGNVISGNAREGVIILGANATGNSLWHNLIGTQADGTSALGNGSHGVFLIADPSDNAIGSSTGVSNTIAYNAGDGVLALSGTGNQILSNSIFTNTELGIDLGDDNAVTPNDDSDPDAGANNLQNFPVLTTASVNGNTTIEGVLNSTPNTQFTIQFFSNTVCDPSGFGEGRTYLEADTTTTDPSGKATTSVTIVSSDLTGQFVTATATDPYSNTSEFSNCIPVPAAPVLTTAKQVQDLNGGAALPGDTLRYTISYGNIGNAPSTGVFITDTYSIYCITRTNVTNGDFLNHDDNGTSLRWPETGGILLDAQDSGSVRYDCTLPITFTVADDYDVTNTATIESDQPTSAQDMVTVTVTAAPVLTITKECTPTTGIIPSDTVGCVIQYANTGDANATGVEIEDDYDQSKVSAVLIITGSVHFVAAGTDDGNTITWDGTVTIPAGESGQVEYDYELFGADAFPDVTTQVTNTVSINSTETGPEQDTETICVIRFDFNRNGEVDVGDVQAVAARWRLTAALPDPDGDPSTPNYEEKYDVNGDGIITVVDIMMVAAEWGQTCP